MSGRTIMHIERVFDQGVEKHLYRGKLQDHSIFYFAVICGGMHSGPTRATTFSGDGVEKTHEERRCHLANGYPELLPQNVQERYRPCPVCFSVYQVERAKILRRPSGINGKCNRDCHNFIDTSRS